MNTCRYGDYPVIVRDGMPLRGYFKLDTCGFTIVKGPTAIRDFYDQQAVDADCPREVEALVARLTAADKVAAQGRMIRTSGDLSSRTQEKVEGYVHAGGIQPPAGKAHVD